MKRAKSILSVILVIAMIATVFTTAANASSVWELVWSNTEEATRGIIMQPGADETQRNFSWYMPADVTSCHVAIADNPLMANARKVEGTVIDAYQGDKVAKVTVTGLELGKTYYYNCVSGDKASATYPFKTVAGNDFTALYISDIHITDGEESVKETAFAFADLLADATRKADVNIILSAGDQATDGLRNEYEGLSFSPISRSLSFATTIGNHDRKGLDYKYFTNLPNEYDGAISSYQGGDYYFVKGDVLFLFLDSNNASGINHRKFVKNAVEANPDVKWRVVVMHHDLYAATIESRESDNELLRLIYSPLFDEFNIDLALLGHSHHYSVSDVIYNGESVGEITNGGTVTNAGGTVYMVSASVGRARDPKGEIPYSDLISIGMDEYTDRLYSLIDFTDDSITVTTHEVNSNDVHASFTLTKSDDFEPENISFFRRTFSAFVNTIGSVYAIFNNFGRFYDFMEDGYEVSFFEVIF